ncbi:MAG: alkaline phosphatase family protein [Sediminibacterium sp.]|nr:MAG: alkaline phosphatase family protein [Sediminibacterium sp.]
MLTSTFYKRKIIEMRYILFTCLSLFLLSSNAQNQKSLSSVKVNASKQTITQKPRLVVGIIVDQMRWDYVNRFKPFFKSSSGFTRFINEGATVDNTLIPYLPTVTASGHACVYTGSVPALHGIAGNEWYDNVKQKKIYCVEDANVQTIGSSNNAAGQMSPVNVWTTTLGDEFKLASNFRSKVFGISLKDRGAIIPAGHSANGAFWYDSKSGNFISSTYYGKSLPTWVTNYNNLHRPDSLYNLDWNLSLPASVYEANCDVDENKYESTPFGKEAKHFPYALKSFIAKDYGKISTTPYGNSLVEELAKQAIVNEAMGTDDITDLLAISFSSPDYIGHSFGPDSWETMDGYIKLDELLADFFNYLDKQVGKDNYTVFLTADHAVANIPAFNSKHQLPAGLSSEAAIKNEISSMLTAKGLNANLISNISEDNIHFNHPLMDSLHISQDVLIDLISSYLEKKPEILQVVDARHAASAPIPASLRERVVNSYSAQRSGDLVIINKSGYVDGFATGTSHGTLYNYDAHIPLLFFGKGIKKTSVHRETYMTDIAPTITTLLGIQMPSGSIGKPILEVIQ